MFVPGHIDLACILKTSCEAMVESMESIKTAAVHADARAELANLLDKASEELAAGLVLFVAFLSYKV